MNRPAQAIALVWVSIVAIEVAGTRVQSDTGWVGTWATAPQFSGTADVDTYVNQTLRLIAHTSTSGRKARIRISNTYGDQPLEIGAAHIARRARDADIDPRSDRTLTFRGTASTTIPAGSMTVSDAVDLDVPALADLAISLFLPRSTPVTTVHTLALQTSYVSSGTGDSTGAVRFPSGRTISTWPFLTGIDVAARSHGGAIVAFGSS